MPITPVPVVRWRWRRHAESIEIKIICYDLNVVCLPRKKTLKLNCQCNGIENRRQGCKKCLDYGNSPHVWINIFYIRVNFLETGLFVQQQFVIKQGKPSTLSLFCIHQLALPFPLPGLKECEAFASAKCWSLTSYREGRILPCKILYLLGNHVYPVS